jgi:DNA/RNA endonuclease YhcR with UshA esterase domain
MEEVQEVEGRIRFVFNNGKAVYLGFQNPHQGALKIRILRPYWDRFPLPPEQMIWPGTAIRVRGQIDWYQGDPQILVEQPDQIRIVDSLWLTDLAFLLRTGVTRP